MEWFQKARKKTNKQFCSINFHVLMTIDSGIIPLTLTYNYTAYPNL